MTSLKNMCGHGLTKQRLALALPAAAVRAKDCTADRLEAVYGVMYTRFGSYIFLDHIACVTHPSPKLEVNVVENGA